MRDQHLVRLERIFQEICETPGLQLRPDLTALDIPEWDSVAMVQIVMEVEREFNLRMSTDEVARIKNVGDLLAVIKQSVTQSGQDLRDRG